MKYISAASAIVALAAAQWGPPYGESSDYISGLPSCLSSCFATSSGCDIGNVSCYCNSTSISTLNTCISGTSCSDSDKEGAYQSIAQLCVDVGASVTASPEATFSATSGGTAWPTQWTTNSAYAAALSSWKTQTTGVPGPFEDIWGSSTSSGPFGDGWGPWASDHTGAWSTGAWTEWWGSSACPPSTWTGWTSGAWSATPAWTSWTACTETTTAASVVTTTVTLSGHTTVVTTTAFAIKVAEASVSNTGNAAAPTNNGAAGVAAGVVGVLAGAILL